MTKPLEFNLCDFKLHGRRGRAAYIYFKIITGGKLIERDVKLCTGNAEDVELMLAIERFINAKVEEARQ
jgi:hypothetical protein